MTTFWDDEPVNVEVLRKREHKIMLELLCVHVADLFSAMDDARSDLALDALKMYMTIDLGPSTPRAAVRAAIEERVDQLIEASKAETAAAKAAAK